MSEFPVSEENKRNTDLVGIEYLPENVIEKILTYIPIAEAVRTSLISSAWRYRWRQMSDLVFVDDDYSDEYEPGEEEEREHKLVDVVHRVLLLHVGKIRRFKYNCCLKSFHELDIWMHVLRNADIQELSLRFILTDYCYQRQEIPSTLLSCNSLKYLDLRRCSLRIPPSFKGLDNLTTSIFVSVMFDGEKTIETLIRNCPRLKCLTLTYCYGFEGSNIVSTTLRELSLHECALFGVRLDVPMLASLSFTTEIYGSLDIIHLLPNLAKLELIGFSLRVLAFDNGLCNITAPFRKLKTLKVCKFNCIKQTTALICLLRSSPMLENLYIYHEYTLDKLIETPGIPIPMSWKVENVSFTYSCLRNLKISTSCEDATALVEFLLPNAPLLGEASAYHGLSSSPYGDVFCYHSSK